MKKMAETGGMYARRQRQSVVISRIDVRLKRSGDKQGVKVPYLPSNVEITLPRRVARAKRPAFPVRFRGVISASGGLAA